MALVLVWVSESVSQSVSELASVSESKLVLARVQDLRQYRTRLAPPIQLRRPELADRADRVEMVVARPGEDRVQMAGMADTAA